VQADISQTSAVADPRKRALTLNALARMPWEVGRGGTAWLVSGCTRFRTTATSTGPPSGFGRFRMNSGLHLLTMSISGVD